MGIVPGLYQDQAKAFLTKVRTNLQRVAELEKRVANLRRAKSDGKDPLNLLGSIHVPSYQYPATYAYGKHWQESLEALTKQFAASAFAMQLEAAEDELEATKAAAAEGVVAKAISEAFLSIYQSQKGRKFLSFSEAKDGDGLPIATEKADSTPAWDLYLRACRCTGAAYSIIRDREAAAVTRRATVDAEKKVIKDRSSVHVGDGAVADQAVVEKAVEKTLAKKGLTAEKVWDPRFMHLVWSDFVVFADQEPYFWPTREESDPLERATDAAGKHPRRPSGPLVSPLLSRGLPTSLGPATPVQIPEIIGQGQRKGRRGRGETTPAAGTSRAQQNSRREAQGWSIHARPVSQGEQKVARRWWASLSRQVKQQYISEYCLSFNWRYEHHTSWPDAILLLPENVAVATVLQRASKSFLQLARYRALIHVGPGIDLAGVPLSIFAGMSAGLKYLLFSGLDVTLPLSAYEHFCNTIRWKYAYTLKDAEYGSKREEIRYYHEFALPKDASEAPKASEHIEAGLRTGRQWLESQLSNISKRRHDHKDHGLVNVNQLKKDIQDRDWMVLPTDKNLGCALVSRGWYLSGAYKLLSAAHDYEKISTSRALVYLRLTKTNVKNLATHPAVSGPTGRQFREWLVSRISEDDPFKGLPHFYVLPKIHKDPWGYRPIVPCHSCIQGPAAKLLDFVLQPLLIDRPYVLQSSKELAKRLSAIKIPKGQKVFIVSGDVTAFYPNVDVEVARGIVLDYLRDGYQLDNSDKDVLHADFLERLWNVANGALLLRFQDDLYRQKRGLAMGVACSPTIANLYGAYFEERVIPQIHGLLLYLRYIDDCLALVCAVNAAEALAKMKLLTFKGCEIVWAVSDVSCVFLDMEISLDSSSVSYRPYRKPQNSFERIPFASHHPLDVKRGTFIGEMTRLAYLSSRKSYYEDALRELRDIYVARGYPKSLLNSWLSNHATERWMNRFVDKGGMREHESVHVLKTVFNPVWEYVKADDLRKVIWEHWSREDFSDERCGESEMLRQTKVTEFFASAAAGSPAELHQVTGAPKSPYGPSGRQLLPPVEDEQLERPSSPVGVVLHRRTFRTVGNVSLLHAHRVSASPESARGAPRGVFSGPSRHGSADDVARPTQHSPSAQDSVLEEGEIHQQVEPFVSFLDRRIIFSRKRSRVLGDLVNDWRRQTLAYTPGSEAFQVDDQALSKWTKI